MSQDSTALHAATPPGIARQRREASSSLLALEPVCWQLGLEPVILDQPVTSLGSDPECSVAIKVAGVEPRHAIIEHLRGTLTLRSQSKRTWLNDTSVSEAQLRPGDRLSLGPVVFRVRLATSDELLASIPEPERPPRGGPAAQHWTAQPGPGESFAEGREPQGIAALPDARQLPRDNLLADFHQRLDALERLQAELAEELRHEDRRGPDGGVSEQAASAAQQERLAREANELQRLEQDLEFRRGQWEEDREQTERALRQQAEKLAARRRVLHKFWRALRERRANMRRGAARAQLRLERALADVADLHHRLLGREAQLRGAPGDWAERAARPPRPSADLPRLEQRLAEREQDLQRREAELAERHAQQQEESRRLKSLEAELNAQWRRRCDEAAETAARQEAQWARQRDELAASRADLEAREREAQASALALQALSTELQARQQAIERSQRDLEAAREQLESQRQPLETQRASLAAQSARLEEQRREVEEQRRALEADRGAAAHELRAADELAARTKKLHDELERKLAQLDQMTRQQSDAADLLARERRALDQERAELVERGLRLAQQASQVADDRARLAAEQSERECEARRLNDERQRIRELQDDLAAQQAALEAERTRWAGQQAQADKFQRQAREAEEQLRHDRQRLEAQRAALKQHEQELEEQARQLRDLENRLAATGKELDTERAQIDAERARCAALHDASRQQLESDRARWEAECDDKLRRFAEHEAQLAEERQRLQAERAALDAIFEEAQARTARLDEREAQLAGAAPCIQPGPVDAPGDGLAAVEGANADWQARQNDLERREAEFDRRVQEWHEQYAQDQARHQAECRQQLERLQADRDSLDAQRQDLEQRSRQLELRAFELDRQAQQFAGAPSSERGGHADAASPVEAGAASPACALGGSGQSAFLASRGEEPRPGLPPAAESADDESAYDRVLWPDRPAGEPAPRTEPPAWLAQLPVWSQDGPADAVQGLSAFRSGAEADSGARHCTNGLTENSDSENEFTLDESAVSAEHDSAESAPRVTRPINEDRLQRFFGPPQRSVASEQPASAPREEAAATTEGAEGGAARPGDYELKDVDSDSIAEYMNRLIARTRRSPGSSDGEPAALQGIAPPKTPQVAPWPPPSLPAQQAPQKAAGFQGSVADDPPAPADAPILPEVERPSRPRVVEDRRKARDDLKTMREVANQSARTAVARARWKQGRVGFLLRTAIAMGCLIWGGAIWLVNSQRFQHMALAACAIGAVAFIDALRALVVIFRPSAATGGAAGPAGSPGGDAPEVAGDSGSRQQSA